MPRILVVEDHPVNLKLFVAHLTGANYEVVTAVDADIAEEILKHETFDLIVMDIALPGKSGLDLTLEIRANAQLQCIPILCVTAFAMVGDAEAGLQSGCTEYMTKPISCKGLLDSVAKLLDQKDENA